MTLSAIQGSGIVIHLMPDQAELRLAVIKKLPGGEPRIKFCSVMIAVTAGALIHLGDFSVRAALRSYLVANIHMAFFTQHILGGFQRVVAKLTARFKICMRAKTR